MESGTRGTSDESGCNRVVSPMWLLPFLWRVVVTMQSKCAKRWLYILRTVNSVPRCNASMSLFDSNYL